MITRQPRLKRTDMTTCAISLMRLPIWQKFLKYDMVMTQISELKQKLIEASVVCRSNIASSTPNDSFSLGDGVLPSKHSTDILDTEQVRRKGRPPSKRKEGGGKKIVNKKGQTKKKTLSKEKAKDVEEIAVGHVSGTQESHVNVNGYPSYMGQLMWPNLMPHNMQPNMTPNGISFNQFLHNVPSSQSSMPSSLNSRVWRGQSGITGCQGWGGSQPSLMESQWQGWNGGQELKFT